MIEEIKKEIKSLPHYSEYMQNINGSHWNIDTVCLCGVYEILNKYKDKEDKYKNAWEELKEFNINSDWYINEPQVETMKELIEELEQKHFIESWGKDE